MPLTLAPRVRPFTISPYTPALPRASQLLGTFFPCRMPPPPEMYRPMWLSCVVGEGSHLRVNIPVLEKTPPQVPPVPGSCTPAYESRLSFTLSRTAVKVNGPFFGRKRRPPIKL